MDLDLNKNILIGISCIPKNYDVNFLKTIFKSIKEFQPKNILIMYADTLQRYNLISFDGYSSSAALDLSITNGKIMKKMIIDAAEQAHLKYYSILNWEEFSSVFGKTKEFFTLLYRDCIPFQIYIDELVLFFHNRRLPQVDGLNKVKAKKQDNIKQYIFEELLNYNKSFEYCDHHYDTILYPINQVDIQNHFVHLSKTIQTLNFLLLQEIHPFLKREGLSRFFQLPNSGFNAKKVIQRLFDNRSIKMKIISNSGKIYPINMESNSLS